MWNEMYLYNLVRQFLPPMAEVLVPENQYGRPAITIADLDGDNIPEITAAYSWHGKPGSIILKNFFGFWYPVDYNFGNGYETYPYYYRNVAESTLYPAAIKTVDGTKWGYIDNQGFFVIKPQYENAMDFQSNGLAVVQKGEHSGIIDRFSKYVVPPKYDSIMEFSEGRAAVVDKAGFKVIDESGKVITTRAYNFIGMYQEGRALFGNTNPQGEYRYGYLDRHGREILPAQYEEGSDFKDGKALVKIKEKQYALIGLNGETLHTYNYVIVSNLGDGLLAFRQDYNSEFGYIDINGNVVLPPQYTTALPFSRDRAVVNTSVGIINQYGLIDKKGNFIIKPLYNDITPLGENRAAVGIAIDEEKPYIGSKYAVADTVSGNILTDFVYTNVLSYKEGYASASNDKNTFFIDEIGKIEKSLPIIKGSGSLSFVGELIKANVDFRAFYLDRTGKVVWQPNIIISLNSQYKIIQEKYKPNKDYLVYYPQIDGIKNNTAQKSVNNELKKLSQVKPIDGTTQLDYSYTGDFSIEFYKKDLLVFKLDSYQYYFGAAHGMPTEAYPHIDLLSGKFYKLKDLFKPGSNYVKVLSDIIGAQIKNNPEYSYVFPDSYKGISKDQPFYVKEDALFIYFNPYEIAPYAVGFPTFRIPYAEIMPIINTKGEFWKSFH